MVELSSEDITLEINGYTLVVGPDMRIKTVNGEEKLHITDALSDLGLSKSFDGVDPWFAERGKAVHAACRYHLEGVLDESTVSEEIHGYFNAFKTWIKDTGFKHVQSEIPLYSLKHDYCGTLDLVGHVDSSLSVIDIKSSSFIDPAVELQTGAQAILWDENNQTHKIQKRYVLQLKGHGTYRFKELTHIPAYLFLDALKVWRWKMSHKRKKNLSAARNIDVTDVTTTAA